jgi:outer membrane protein TolC
MINPITGEPINIGDDSPLFDVPVIDFDLKFDGMAFAGIRAEQPIFMGGKIVNAYMMSKTGREIASINRDMSRAEIIVKTDEAYWLHLKALKSKEIALALRDMIDELLKNVEIAEQSGKRTHNDVLKVQIQKKNVELQIAKADNAVLLSRMNLCQLIGLSMTEDIMIDTAICEYSFSAVETSNAPSVRHEYKILDRQVKFKKQEMNLVCADFLPQIGVSASYGYMYGLKMNGTPMFDRASWSAIFSLKIPILHWGEGVHKIRAAKVEKQIAEIQRDELTEKMELEMRQTRNKLNESILEVSMNALAFEDAEENLRITRDSYETGLVNIASYIEAQILWQRTKLNLIESQVAQRITETQYLRANGDL